MNKWPLGQVGLACNSIRLDHMLASPTIDNFALNFIVP